MWLYHGLFIHLLVGAYLFPLWFFLFICNCFQYLCVFVWTCIVSSKYPVGNDWITWCCLLLILPDGCFLGFGTHIFCTLIYWSVLSLFKVNLSPVLLSAPCYFVLWTLVTSESPKLVCSYQKLLQGSELKQLKSWFVLYPRITDFCFLLSSVLKTPNTSSPILKTGGYWLETEVPHSSLHYCTFGFI